MPLEQAPVVDGASRPAPVAVVSSQPDSVRVVELVVSADQPRCRVAVQTVDSGGSDPHMSDRINDLDTRLRTVETALSRIEERLKHMPTSLQAWGMVAALGAVIWGVVQFAGPSVIETAVERVLTAKGVGSK